jgi:hypothetical protein
VPLDARGTCLRDNPIMTPIEAAAAFVALTLVFLCGTLGSHFGLVMAVLGAWAHDPVMVAIGWLWSWLCMPTGNDDGGSGNGRARHA